MFGKCFVVTNEITIFAAESTRCWRNSVANFVGKEEKRMLRLVNRNLENF